MLRYAFLLVAVLVMACVDAPENDPAQPEVVQQPPVVAVSDTTADPATLATFNRVVTLARSEELHMRPYGEIIQAVGESLVGTPYQDGLLDVGSEETLVVDLTGFDCVLYVENVLALSKGIAQEDYSFASYMTNLENLRYRNGALDGYCSRLHYFTDWIFDNAARDHLVNVTQGVGGVVLPKTLDFMTSHRDSYARLVDDHTYVCIEAMEQAIQGRELFYVSQDRIESIYDQLEAGDVIATATHIGGLDVTHTGFVHRTENGVGFLHASSTGEVKVADDLASYIRGNAIQIGIIIARPVDPRGAD